MHDCIKSSCLCNSCVFDDFSCCLKTRPNDSCPIRFCDCYSPEPIYHTTNILERIDELMNEGRTEEDASIIADCEFGITED